MDYSKKIPKLSKYLNKISISYLKNNINLYQDLSLKNSGLRNETENRWRLIKKKLIKDKIKNLLDLGSAEGFFLKKTSKMKIMSLGIEADERRFFLSNFNIENKKKYFGVVNNTITSEFIKLLPKFDTILYLSVHHHIAANSGVKKANDLLVKIFKNCEKTMFFETAIKNEQSKSWHKGYEKNLKNITEKSIKSLFLKQGCKKFEILGYTESYNKGFKRPLFYIAK